MVKEEGFLTEELKKLDIPYRIFPVSFWQMPFHNTIKDIVKFIPRIFKIVGKEKSAIKRLNVIVRDWKPDIIYTNVSVIDVGYKVAKKNHIPHLWHIREYGDLDFNIQPLTGVRRRFKKLSSSYCICITEDLKNYNDLGINAKVIYNIIKRENVPVQCQKEKTIIFVGRVTENKGATEVLKGFIEFSKLNPEYRLEFLGRCNDPTYMESLEDLTKKGNISDKVVFRGQVTDIAERMQRASAIIVASKSEGFGRITAEAMLNHCLVIGRNTAGTKEQLDNGFNLWGKEIGMRYESIDGLVATLNKLAKMDKMEYEEISNRAQATVERLYNPQEHLDNFCSFLDKILKTYDKTDESK
ncbi:MAG: glycosyltransferase family 4 protein [Ruminococcus sp.]|nr:glycosyltransferase family 4 protein [Ruminococcus sp.]